MKSHSLTVGAMMAFPVPPGVPQPPEQGLEPLTPDDAALIIDRELKPIHKGDPTVLKFINAYLVTRDVRDSAKAAGVDVRSARTLLSRRDIHNAITKVTATAVVKYGLDPNEIVEKVKSVAFFDPIDMINPDGTVKTNMHDIAPEARRAIKKFKIKNLFETDTNGIKVPVGHIAEIEVWDKLKAIEFLGREKGLFKETVKQEFELGENMKEVLLGSRDRAAERMARLRDKGVIDVSGNSQTVRGGANNQPGDGGDDRGLGQARQGEAAPANTVRVLSSARPMEDTESGQE